ncbi:MAG: DUF4421 family protein [Bacteroidaceae bacterium]|nr:DUF4421 family protein [Bacteroidaceae bacterium]
MRAQSRVKKLWTKADSLLTKRYYRSPYDTSYVVRPDGKLTLKLRWNQTGNSIRSKGTVNDLHFKSHLSTSHKTTISIGAAYRGISLAYSINPAKLRGFYDDYELNFNFYASRFCIDASYQESSSLSGDMTFGDETLRMEQGEADMKVFNITGYYVFNHRHYSVSAAYNQSYIQRRSAGSWLVGLSYQGGHIQTSDKRKEQMPDDPDIRIYVGHIGIGGGYGYNLVLGKKWLFNLSLLPTFVVYNRNKLTINDESQHAGRMKFNMLFNERLAIVYNFSPRYFVGLNGVANNSLFVDDAVTAHQSKWVARAFVGMRLWK